MTDPETSPEAIAREALNQLGQTPGDNPIAQLTDYANQASALLQEMRERMYLTHQPPADLDEYSQVRDAVFAARLAAVRVQNAIETKELQAMFDNPTHAPEVE